MARVIVAGCLCMVYMCLTGGAQQIGFARALGATPFHIGVMGAIPPGMLLMQFVSALMVNRLRTRKRLWLVLMVTERALFIPIALLPWLLPGAPPAVLVWSLVALLGVSECLGMFSQPIFFGWMGDLLPHHNLNYFWARRRKWLSAAQAVSMLVAAAIFYLFKSIDIRITYSVVASAGALAGIADILQFIRIPEPPPLLSTERRLARLVEPFRDERFRGFIAYSVAWTFSMMMAAPFFQLYLLKEFALPVHTVVLLYTFHALGGALFAESFGRVADRFGQRPVIVLCTALKSLVVIAMFLMRPGAWLALLIPVFVIDNMLNTGLLVSRNGFMLKLSPKDNRPMYVAAVLATSGLAGALGALAGGAIVEHAPVAGHVLLGVELTGFRAVFAASTVLRLLSIGTAWLIREPRSSPPGEVLVEVIGPALLRWLLFPLGYFARHDHDDAGPP